MDVPLEPVIGNENEKETIEKARESAGYTIIAIGSVNAALTFMFIIALVLAFITHYSEAKENEKLPEEDRGLMYWSMSDIRIIRTMFFLTLPFLINHLLLTISGITILLLKRYTFSQIMILINLVLYFMIFFISGFLFLINFPSLFFFFLFFTYEVFFLLPFIIFAMIIIKSISLFLLFRSAGKINLIKRQTNNKL